MPISPWYCKPEREFNFSSCSEWNKFLKRFSGSTKECATKDQTLNHNLVNISFFKNDELDLVGKCVKHSFRIYMDCYLQFCITKKLWPVNKNLSKVHFLNILSAHAKGLNRLPDESSSSSPKKKVLYRYCERTFCPGKDRTARQNWNCSPQSDQQNEPGLFQRHFMSCMSQ